MGRKDLSLVVPVVFAVAALSGCAYHVHTVGASNPESSVQLNRRASFSVVKTPDSPEREWDRELSVKIERMLERTGYSTASSSEADYYLFFDYRIKALSSRVRLELITGTSQGMETVRKGGPFVHTLAFRIVDAAEYRSDGTERVVWQGGAVMNDVPTEGTRFHDLVLVAAFESFGKDTPETVTLKIARSDSRVRRLRSP